MVSGARPSGAVYGIDLGTTYSCLAAVGANGAADVVPLLDGSLTLPSVVLFVGADDYVTGEPARLLARAQPDDVCTLVKRRMGDGEWRFVSHGRSWSAPAVSSLVLKALVSETAFSAGPITDVVITVPAYFGDEERRATKLAGEYAGLTVLDVINEPTAAALSYGFARLDGRSPQGHGPDRSHGPTDGAEEVALVFDLGGGTVDVTVVELADRRLAVVAIDGDHELGGADWDEKLAVHLSRAFAAAHPDAEDPLDDSAGAQALVLAAERAKRQLTVQDSVVVAVQHDGHQLDVTVTRAEFERLTAGCSTAPPSSPGRPSPRPGSAGSPGSTGCCWSAGRVGCRPSDTGSPSCSACRPSCMTRTSPSPAARPSTGGRSPWNGC